MSKYHQYSTVGSWYKVERSFLQTCIFDLDLWPCDLDLWSNLTSRWYQPYVHFWSRSNHSFMIYRRKTLDADTHTHTSTYTDTYTRTRVLIESRSSSGWTGLKSIYWNLIIHLLRIKLMMISKIDNIIQTYCAMSATSAVNHQLWLRPWSAAASTFILWAFSFTQILHLSSFMKLFRLQFFWSFWYNRLTLTFTDLML